MQADASPIIRTKREQRLWFEWTTEGAYLYISRENCNSFFVPLTRNDLIVMLASLAERLSLPEPDLLDRILAGDPATNGRSGDV